MTDTGELSWEAQEVFQKIKMFNRLPGAGIPLIQLNMKVGSAKTVKKGVAELKSAGLITETASGEPTLTDKGHQTSVWFTAAIKLAHDPGRAFCCVAMNVRFRV
jgi:hypothetical protein